MTVTKKTIIKILFLTIGVIAGFFFCKSDFILKPNTGTILKKVIAQIIADEIVTFDTEKNKTLNHNISIRFSDAVSKIDAIGKVIKTGINIEPDIKGVFKWEAADNIIFYPEDIYLIGTTYKIKFDKRLFNETTDLQNSELKFTTPDIFAKIEKNTVAEDITDIKNKKAVAVISFDFPVNKESFAKNVNVVSDSGIITDYRIEWNDYYTKAYISIPVKIAEKSQKITIKAENVKARDYEYLIKPISFSINIPSQSDYFKITDIKPLMIRDEKNNNTPNQILTIEFSSAVKVEDVAKHVTINGYIFNNGKKVKDKVLPLSIIPSADEYSDSVSFRYKPGYYKQILVSISSGLLSRDNYKINTDRLQDFYVPPYPLEMIIGFDGDVMTSRGEKYLTLESRGIRKAEIEIARVMNNQINHLITQSNGNFKDFQFSTYSFDEYNIADIYREKMSLTVDDPEKLNYSSVDLNKYLNGKTGVFIIKARGGFSNYYEMERKKLILVTDLGILVKHGTDGKSDVFVSSVKDGIPLKDVKVSVIGKNGIPVLVETTDADGHVSFLKNDNLIFEKTPTIIKAELNGDTSFIPYDNYSNRINYSKFTIGGEYEGDGKRIRAEIFTDRGIYRPGEMMNAGIIFRNGDLKSPVKLPIKVTINDSFGKEIFNRSLIVNSSGISTVAFSVPETAKIGDYEIRIITGDGYYVADKSFKVAEFVPDRMKMTAGCNLPAKKGWLEGKELPFNVTLYNLFGVPAAERKIKAELNAVLKTARFESFDGYVFNQQNDEGSAENTKTVLEEKQTNENGRAEYTLDTTAFQNGLYNLFFSAEGFESDGGRSVGAFTKVTYSNAPFMVGFKADGDLNYIHKNTKRKVSFVAVNSNLDRIELNNLSLKTTKTEKLSALLKDKNGMYRYQTVNKNIYLSERDFNVKSESDNAVILDTTVSGDYRLVIYDKASGKTLSDIPYSVVGTETRGISDKNAELGLKLDRAEYTVGEEIEADISVPYSGYGIISIESNKLHTYKWFKTDKKNTQIKIKIPKDVKGNAYVNVAFVRDFSSKDIFMSPLSYAVAPFMVNKDKYRLNVDIKVTDENGKTKDRYEPGETIKVKYKTSDKAKIIIYGVDEGILQLTEYKLPIPVNTFLRKKALGVDTYQILDLIIPDFSHIKDFSHIGGDADGVSGGFASGLLNPFSRKSENAVVFWSGIMDSDKAEKEYSYKLPDTFNGALKVMAVASATDGIKTGSKEKAIKIRGDYVVLPNVARFVSPSDKFSVSVAINNLKTVDDDFTVTINTDDKIIPVGDLKQTVNISAGKEKTVVFELKAKENLGPASLNFNIVNSDGKKNKIESSLSVRPPLLYQNLFKSGFSKGALKIKDINIPMYENMSALKVQVGNSPIVLASALSDYLDNYDFTCTEQITSKMFALLVNEPDGEKKYQKEFAEYLSDLSSRQLPNGGFALFPYGSNVHEQTGMYVLHFLLYATSKGYIPNEGMLDSLKTWVRNQITSNSIDSLYAAKLKVYGIYLLTLSGEVTTSYILEFEEHMNLAFKAWKNSFISVLTASVYRMLGDKDKSENLLKFYQTHNKEKVDENFYGEAMADYALELYLLKTVFNDNSVANKANLEKLLLPVMEGKYNTLTSAYSLLALSSFSNNEIKEIDLSVFDEKNNLIKFEKEKTSLLSIDLTSKKVDTVTSGTKGLYYIVNNKGFPRNPVKTIKDGVEITREYAINGKAVISAKIGDDIDVTIRMRAINGNYNRNLAVVDLFTGGFEYITDSFRGDADYTDIREDRMIAYLDVGDKVKEIHYKVKATAKGDFIIPSVELKSLDNPFVKAVYGTNARFIVE